MKKTNKLIENENRLASIFNRYQDKAFAIVSAAMENLSDLDIKRKTLKLRSMIREKRLEFIPVADESYFITSGYMSAEELFNFAIDLCKEFNQTCILFSDGKGSIAYYDKSSNIIDYFDDIVFNDQTNIEYFDESLIHYRSVNWGTSRINRNYRELIKLEEAKSEIEMFDKLVDIDLGRLYKRDLKHIVKLLFNENIEFNQSGTLNFDGHTYEYTTVGLKEGRIKISKVIK